MSRDCALVRKALSALLCSSLVWAFVPGRVAAEEASRILIEIGQPSIWSLGQAHYLLAKMHGRDRNLETRPPSEEDLDPNRIGATRIEALRSALGLEAQYDQAMAVRNEIARRQFQQSEIKREKARADLRAKQAELDQLDRDLAALDEEIAVLTEQVKQDEEDQTRVTPERPPTREENERKIQLALLGARKARKEQERTELKAEIAALKTTVDTVPSAPTLEEPSLTAAAVSPPSSAAYTAFMDKALSEAGKPDLTASIKLDNFVQMQYEIIAKQLTLLRDEVGPDDRVVFLELPASIYTVDRKADGYVAQVEWEVTRYYDEIPAEGIRAEVMEKTLEAEGKTSGEVVRALSRTIGISKGNQTLQRMRQKQKLQLEGSQDSEQSPGRYLNKPRLCAEAMRGLPKDSRERLREHEVKDKDSNEDQEKGQDQDQDRDQDQDQGKSPYPITLEMIQCAIKNGSTGKPAVESVGPSREKNDSPRYEECRHEKCSHEDGEADEVHSRDLSKVNVRAIDIIPRQSALNVNERHATVKSTGLLAAFKFLVGFAGKVDYQRQREMYDQFVQQQIFASGYGKGTNKFGWTFGPQPGTKRIAPGQRTTFAVLAVARNTLALELTARGRYFKRHEAPDDPWEVDASPEKEVRYLIAVPGQQTQEFWVEGISYVPVKKGRRVTVFIEGNYFSPQLGVLVNGVPLEPVLSISRRAGSEDEPPDVKSADGVAGEYEITNSRNIVLSFTMGESYVGTPSITLTSPEKSTSINFWRLDVNHLSRLQGLTSLQEHSTREPMFIGDFSLKPELDAISIEKACNVTQPCQFGLARLKGEGFRPEATIMVNDVLLSDYNKRMAQKARSEERIRRGDQPRIDSVDNACAQIRRLCTPPCGPPCTPPCAPPCSANPYDDAFMAQESTSSYLVCAPGLKEPKRRISYRQPTRQGFEGQEFTEEDHSPPLLVHEVRNYAFHRMNRRGEVDLTFKSTVKEAKIRTISLDDPESGRCQPIRHDGPDCRVKCLVPADGKSRHERDFITIKVTLDVTVVNKDTKVETHEVDTKYMDIRLPVRPTLTTIVNPRTARAEGYTDEEPTVVISGVNLQGVTSVLFGDREAKVAGAASPDVLAIKVPKGPAVAKGQASAVPVIFRTGAGQIPSGAIYTYLGEPLPPNVIVCGTACTGASASK